MNRLSLTIDEWLEQLVLYPSLKTMSPLQAAAFVHFLIQHEVKPGGPYVFNTPRDTEINASLRQYLLAQQKPSVTPTKQPLREPWRTIYRHTLIETKEVLSRHMRKRLRMLFQTLSDTDEHKEISNLSKCFYNSLSRKPPLLNRQLKALGISNCYLWLAYSLADKIIDTATHADLAPIAHYFSGMAFLSYEEAGLSTRQLHACATITDKAISAEQLHSQTTNLHLRQQSIKFSSLPSIANTYSLLGRKSYAHLAGPATILNLSDYSNAEKSSIMALLEDYCALRQLNDDLHDWKDDLSRKNMTYTVTRLIHDYIESSIQKTSHTVTLQQLQKTFFTHTLSSCIETLTSQYKTNTLQLRQISVFCNQTFIDTIITPHVNALQTIQAEQRYTQDFLNHYSALAESSDR